jgi:hypothetical protein
MTAAKVPMINARDLARTFAPPVDMTIEVAAPGDPPVSVA